MKPLTKDDKIEFAAHHMTNEERLDRIIHLEETISNLRVINKVFNRTNYILFALLIVLLSLQVIQQYCLQRISSLECNRIENR